MVKRKYFLKNFKLKSKFTAWHYRFFVPQDVPGLIQLFGNDSFIEELTAFFENSKLDPFNVLPNPYYWAGNEEDLLSVYLFDFAKRPDLTQKYVRWLLDNKYTALPEDGLPGKYEKKNLYILFNYF